MPRRIRKSIQIREDLFLAVKQLTQTTRHKIVTQVELLLEAGLNKDKEDEERGRLPLIKIWVSKLPTQEIHELLVYIGNLLRHREQQAQRSEQEQLELGEAAQTAEQTTQDLGQDDPEKEDNS